MSKDVTYQKWSEEKAREAYSLRERGMTSQQIADSWGVSRNVVCGLVWRAIKRLGLPAFAKAPPRPKRAPKPRVERQMRVYKALAAPKVVLAQMPVAPEPLYVTFMDLRVNHCRWPEGLGKGLASTYCGHPKKEGSSYCHHHHMRSTRDIRR